MGRFAKGLRAGLPAAACLAAGCASHYGESKTSTLIWGSLFLLVGIGAAVSFMYSRK